MKKEKKTNIEKIVNFEEKKLYLNTNQFKLHEGGHLVILKEKGFPLKPPMTSNFVYCLGLPYDLSLHEGESLFYFRSIVQSYKAFRDELWENQKF